MNVILSIYLIFCDPYFPTIKFIFNAVIVESFTEGIVKLFSAILKNCGIVLPMISLNNKGVPQLLQMQDILVFCPNLKLKPDVPEVKRQFPWASTNEKLLFPPIVSKVDTLYPTYPTSIAL